MGFGGSGGATGRTVTLGGSGFGAGFVSLLQPAKKVTAIHKEKEAIDYALQHAQKDSFIVITSDVIPDALEQVKQYKAVEDEAGGVL